MKAIIILFSLSTLFAALVAFAHGQEKHAPAAMTPGRDTATAEKSIAPAAADAVAAVERFSGALSAGDLDKATAELDAEVLILESGGVQRSRAEYLAAHARTDADFLKSAQIVLRQRAARADGAFAWVASESDIRAMRGEEMLTIASTETMVLRKSAQGWKIVHIHWSSRRTSGEPGH